MGKPKKSKPGPSSRTSEETSTMESYYKLPKLRSFSGDSEVEEFIQEATLLLQIQPLPSRRAAQWIFQSLEGTARERILVRSAEEINTPGKIIEILQNEWGSFKSATSLKRSFYQRTQRKGEGITEFAHALEKLWKKTNEADDDERLSQETLKATFIEGLNLVSLRRELKKLNAERDGLEFRDLIHEARQWVREEEDEEASVKCRLQELKLNESQAKIQALESAHADVQRKLQMAEAKIDELRRDQGGRRPEIKKQLRCWYCDTPGHKEAECRKKKWRERNRRSSGSSQKAPEGNETPLP